ncbi:MAG: serine hydrolase [Oscillospiraceae bacterium]
MRKIITWLLAGTMLLSSVPLRVSADAAQDINFLTRNYESECAVMIFSEDNGVLYSYRSSQLMAGAGLIRLPYAYYLCTKMESGEYSLNDTITYTEDWLRGKPAEQTGAGVIKNSKFGTEYTFAELLDYFLRYSDNIAFDMLISTFGIDEFNAMMREWGSDVTISMANLFPSVTADFLQMCIQKLHENRGTGESWDIVWKALLESKQSYVKEVIGGNIAVKYGYITTEVFQTYNEVCYCDNLQPYILVVMADQSGTNIDKEFIKNIALCADNLVDEYYHLNYSIGNLNADSVSDSIDASLILNAAASIGTTGESGLNKKQESYADIDQNGTIDAADASYILQYSAYVGSGGTASAEVYFKNVAQLQ